MTETDKLMRVVRWTIVGVIVVALLLMIGPFAEQFLYDVVLP